MSQSGHWQSYHDALIDGEVLPELVDRIAVRAILPVAEVLHLLFVYTTKASTRLAPINCR